MTKKIINKVDQYYSEKISEFGTTSKGVDWNGEESHYLRFEQLTKILTKNKDFTLLDFGCGYGSLIQFLNEKKFDYNYTGYDISSAMLNEGKKKFQAYNFTNEISNNLFDFTIANGIFNVKLSTPKKEWEKYMFKTLNQINNLSAEGFSFNILTSYSDKKYMKDYLYYANPLEIFDYCKRNFSRNVALLHDYELYEFTVLVRK